MRVAALVAAVVMVGGLVTVLQPDPPTSDPSTTEPALGPTEEEGEAEAGRRSRKSRRGRSREGGAREGGGAPCLCGGAGDRRIEARACRGSAR